MDAIINTVALDSSEVSKDKKDLWKKYDAMNATCTKQFPRAKKEEQKVIDRKVWKQFNDSVELSQDGYYIRLPDQHPPLSDNRALALKRLANTWSSLKKNDKLLDQYNEVFVDQLNKNIVFRSRGWQFLRNEYSSSLHPV
ncbi:unnamed protein product [Heligmosomoides polygyrus]|uniref:HMG box domain-containing protein n=1 Tax=Heligmosomoides polygyrus TaxID=6339 RepID=A0A183GH90_HELPZ|nr:unnamed protein product [Heligmosomoides polygyrus]